MTCNSCGALIPEGAKFCGICGATQSAPAPVEPAPAPAYQEPPQPVVQEMPAYAAPPAPVYQEPAAYAAQPVYQPQPVYQAPPATEAAPPQGSRYAPISALGYLGYYIVFAVPVLGLILSFVWAKDKTGSINRQNLAKLMLVFKILGILALIVSGVFVAIYWSTISSFVTEGMQAGGFDPSEFYLY